MGWRVKKGEGWREYGRNSVERGWEVRVYVGSMLLEQSCGGEREGTVLQERLKL